LGQWQSVTHSATVPHIVAEVERCGAVENLRQVRDGGHERFHGLWFADSDVYKVLEAVAWDAGRTGDSAFQPFVDETVELLRSVQRPDGYLNSWYQRIEPERTFRDFGRGHEMYCAGHLIQAAVAAARATGQPKLMEIARRYADLLVERFGPGQTEAVCGHPEIETALVELYRETEHMPYLELAAIMIDRRGRGLLGDDEFGNRYFQDHAPVRQATEATGHAVRQLYLAAGVTDVYLETGDTSLLTAMKQLWESAYGSKTYITGGHGSRHRDEAFGDPYELPPDRAYAETCAAIAAFQWNWRMLVATGETRYADVMEWTLHNAIAASTTMDGTAFFYSNPLQMRSGHDGSQEDAPSVRLPWYRIPCCPPNLARLISTLHNYAATTSATGIQVHLYNAGEISAVLDDRRAVVLTIDTDFPWDGTVSVTLADAPEGAPWELALRIPSWARGTTASLNGAAVDVPDGTLRLRREWRTGDVVVLTMPMPARLLRANPKVDAVRGTVAVARGPILYCLESAGQPVDDVVERVEIDTSSQIQPVAGEGLADVPVFLRASGRLIPVDESLYTERAASSGADSVSLTLIPYFRWGNREPGAMRVWIPEAAVEPLHET
jgi:DUF1680 family protein